MTAGMEEVAHLIPHRGVASLVESVVELRPDGVDCLGRIPLGHALVRGGSAPALIGLELAAQSAAIFEALQRKERVGETDPPVGFLVSLRDVRLELPELPAGVPLLASIRLLGRAAELSLYDARVLNSGTLTLQGTLGTFLSPAAVPKGRGEG